MAELDEDDVERISYLDFDLLKRRMAALRALPMPRGSADWRFANTVCRRRVIDLSPEERHQVAVLCWEWRRRGLPHELKPTINPSDPLSPDRLALAMRCTPTLAQAQSDTLGG